MLLLGRPDGTVEDASDRWGVNWLHNTRAALLVDWDNDGDQTVGVFRPSATRFFLSNANRTAPADIEFVFGQSDWLPVAGAD